MTEDFNNRISFLPLDAILKIYHEDKIVDLNNVLEGFKSEFFAITTEKEGSIENYTLIYIGRSNEVKGLSLTSGRSVKDRDLITFHFAKAIGEEFPEKNAISIFNAFQTYLKQIFESHGILCVPEYIATQNSELTFLLAKPKIGVDYLLLIDPLKFYKSFFERINKVSDIDGISKLYLMLEGEKGYIKIGRTRNKLETRRKGVAEPTLKAKDPKIYILTAWVAPKEIEIKLHSEYKSKRKRGEWFDLRAIDLERINELMLNYEMINI